jgi:sugar lactone lactonase YvrE
MSTSWAQDEQKHGYRTMKPLLILFFLGAAALCEAQEYVISTYAGGAPPPTPVPGVNMPLRPFESAVATDALGNTYFVAYHCVFKLDQNGVVTRIAGDGRFGYLGEGGPATSAQLGLGNQLLSSPGLPEWIIYLLDVLPTGITVDGGGNVYVADNYNYRVFKISVAGIITTIAGNGTRGFSGDGGPAINGELSAVFGLALDLSGNLLIADSGANRIRRVSSDGSIATVAGTGDCGFSGDGGPAATAQICGPTGIATDSVGNLFIADTGNSRIRQISPDGSITTLASAVTATIVAVDQAGDLYVNDNETDGWYTWQVVKEISASGTITRVAGLPCFQNPFMGPCSTDDTTAATKISLGGPLGLALDNTGNLLIGDGGNFGIARVSPEGAMITVVGSCGNFPVFNLPNCQKPLLGDGGPATNAELAAPEGVAVDNWGNVFIADYTNDRIRRVTPDGIITTVAGVGTFGSSGDGGPATSAELVPLNVAVDNSGNVFLYDYGLGTRSIRKISPGGIISTVAVAGGGSFVAIDSAGNLFVPCSPPPLDSVCEISPKGTMRRVAGNGTFGFSGDGGLATSAQLDIPASVALDGTGGLYIADINNQRIRKVTPDGVIATIAGSGPTPPFVGNTRGGFSGDGGPAIYAQLSDPGAVAVDGIGNVYIADSGNNRIRKISPDGIITTIAGDGTVGYSGDGGLAVNASFSGVSGLAVDSAGNVYVADVGNNAIRILRPVAPNP